MMRAPVGIAVLSFAHGHAYTYCDQLVKFDDAKLIVCWDDDEERGHEAAQRFGMRYTSNLDDALSDPNVDAVIVTSETNRHAELCIASAKAGKHILLQKPMALTLADCDAIIDAVRSAGVKFSMAFQMRHDPMNIKMRELIRQGAIGRVFLLRRRHCIGVLLHRAFLEGKSRWHVDPEKNMGMFMDDAVHAADFLLWMLGKPVSVIAEIDQIVTDVPTEDTGIAIYRFANKEMGILVNNSVTWAGENTTEIYGDRGVIIQNHGDGPSTNVALPPQPIGLKIYRADEPEKGWQDLGMPIPKSHGERIAGVPRPFVDYLLDRAPCPCTAEEGRTSVEMILGAYKSARSGCRVKFPLTLE